MRDRAIYVTHDQVEGEGEVEGGVGESPPSTNYIVANGFALK